MLAKCHAHVLNVLFGYTLAIPAKGTEYISDVEL